MSPYCPEIVQLLLKNLQEPALNRNVKPPILSCFGDVALAVGGDFEPYLPETMRMLQQAGMTSLDVSNPDLVDYLGQLREGIFEAYTGVLQGLREGKKGTAFQPYLPDAMNLLLRVLRASYERTGRSSPSAHGSVDRHGRAHVFLSLIHI